MCVSGDQVSGHGSRSQTGNPVSSTASVSLTAAGPAGFAAGSVTTVNAIAGLATFGNLKFTRAGSYTLTAHSGTLATAASNSFRVAPAAPAKLTFQGTMPVFMQIGSSVIPRVLVADAFGNPVPGVNVVFTAPLTGPSGKFGASNTATVTTNSSGIAIAPAYTPKAVVGTYIIKVTAGAWRLNISAINAYSRMTRL